MTALIAFLRELVAQLIMRAGSPTLDEAVARMILEMASAIEAAMKRTLLA